MNRTEFMIELASLLQDIPVEERREAMKYYNDYFDDAGTENEEQVIKTLGSPKTIAKIIKDGISGYDKEAGEFTDTGYHDSKYEEQKVLEPRSASFEQKEDSDNKKERWTSKPLKIILIIAIIVCAIPVVLPIVSGILAAAAGIVLAIVICFVALVVASIAVAISGLVLFITGIVTMFGELAAGLAFAGIGLILLPLGAIATVASIKLCIVVFPGIIRGIVWICRKPFHRKAVA